MAAISPSGAEAVLDHIEDEADVIVPPANGEPVTLVDALEAGESDGRLHGVRRDDQVLDRARGVRPDGSARLLLPRHELRLRRVAHRTGAVLPRGQGPDAPHLRSQPGPRQPGRGLAREERFVSINATTEIDLIGQCASETVAGRYWSSSGGQADFARGAM